MKRVKLLFAVAMITVVIGIGGVWSAVWAQTWDCGAPAESVTCVLDANGIFTVSGSGAMADYTLSSERPWHDSRTSITNVIIENGVTSIGNFAFSEATSLTSVTIPNSVTSIGSRAFEGATSLTSITIPNSVTSIGMWAFQRATSLTSITIPNSVTRIGTEAFSGATSLTSINVAEDNAHFSSVDGVLFDKQRTNIIKYPGGKEGTSYTIPNSVTTIGNYAFGGATSLTSITIPNSVTNIGNGAFSSATSLTSVTVPNGVTSIGIGAFFRATSLTSITIPNGVTSIGDFAFSFTGLTSITIPNSVTSIGQYAFSGATSLTSITVLTPEPPRIFSDTFRNVNKTTSCLYVPEDLIAAYQEADHWKDFECIEAAPYSSILSDNREISEIINNEDVAVTAPAISSTITITAGPNPVDRQSGNVNFYITGATVNTGTLTIYDANGNVVNRISISDNVTTWDLKDARGRIVSEGTYLVRGMISAVNGRRERVSVVMGVR